MAVLASAYSLYLGFEFDRNVTASLTRQKTRFTPRVCVVMPCKGDEFGLDRNIAAALHQDYDNYQLAIVVDSKDDPAYAVAKSVLEKHTTPKSEILISSVSNASGKIAALMTAIEATAGQADVYAFIDSDAFATKSWLRDLVDPLVDQTIGSTTGFRWYIPSRGGFWSHVEAAWNASGTNLLFDERYNFPWGGAMALRADTLEKVGIRRIWSAAVSDDMTLNHALRAHGYRIVFLPQCMIATFNKTSRSRFLEWATRQTALTRVFNRGLWNYALLAYGFFDITFLLGVVAAGLGFLFDWIWFLPATLLLSPQLLGVLRSIQRCRTFARAMPQLSDEIASTCLPDAIASFIVPWIMTYCIIRSAHTSEIEWRGRKYTLSGMNSLATS